ncbi:MAG: acetamidase/formamidase family protein [Acidobacteria bacterium]|nr:acetamidase/formamidase family protein [Acidobacteriota bacterium]MBV9625643.1 acetamidase/formamidase family protein [Acidobacteriota bacterium]
MALLSANQASSQNVGEDAVNGEWLVTRDVYGNPLYQKLILKLENGKLTGSLAEDKLEGTLQGRTLHFIARDADNNTSEFTGVLSNSVVEGNIVETNASDPSDRMETRMTATRAPKRQPGPPRRHEFTPTSFYRQFSASNKPVLEIAPGDTVHTTTVDAGGADEHGIRRVLGGNPETGPFYVLTAWPGDTLVVHLKRIRLNRDYAISDDAIVERALDNDMSVKMKDAGKSVRWYLDRERMVARSERPGDHLRSFTVPLRPMLGCVATAPGFASAPPPTGDSGHWGGNMDFNEIVEGVTVYLPVNQPGALLYVGDGHAAQGDGELNGDALETSMEVEFAVDIIPNKRIRTPRVESDSKIMTVGLGGSLEEALRAATRGMSEWLEQDYSLNPSEVAQVLGTSAQFNISEVADRNVGVAAKLSTQQLQPLKRR